MNERIRCPNPMCPQPDDVQKVSAVVERETVRGFAFGDYTVTSPLGEQLATPLEPKNTGRWDLALVVVFPFSLGTIYGFQSGRIAVGAFFVGVILVAVIVTTKAARQYRDAYPRWQNACARWDELYYCNHCSSIFNPSERGRFVSASHMKELLA